MNFAKHLFGRKRSKIDGRSLAAMPLPLSSISTCTKSPTSFTAYLYNNSVLLIHIFDGIADDIMNHSSYLFAICDYKHIILNIIGIAELEYLSFPVPVLLLLRSQ